MGSIERWFFFFSNLSISRSTKKKKRGICNSSLLFLTWVLLGLVFVVGLFYFFFSFSAQERGRLSPLMFMKPRTCSALAMAIWMLGRRTSISSVPYFLENCSVSSQSYRIIHILCGWKFFNVGIIFCLWFIRNLEQDGGGVQEGSCACTKNIQYSLPVQYTKRYLTFFSYFVYDLHLFKLYVCA